MAGDGTEQAPEPSPRLSPGDAAALIADLVDVLLPGGDGWPNGSAAGAQLLLSQRLVTDRSPGSFDELVAALLACGAPFAGKDEAARIAIVETLQASQPALFGWVRDAAFLAYYESPVVVDAIRAKGRPYELRPHLTGYPTVPFDADRDKPRHGRGHFLAEGAVKPVDVASLNLDADPTARWGLDR